MIKLKLGPNISIGIDDNIPKEGIEIVNIMDGQFDKAVKDFVDTFNFNNIIENLGKSVKEHVITFGKWPKFLSGKLVVTHDEAVHKRNIKIFDNIVNEQIHRNKD